MSIENRTVVIILIILGILIALPFIAGFIIFSSYQSKANDEMGLFLAEGGSLRLSGLAPKPIPEGQPNAALLVIKAAGLSKNDERFKEGSKLPPFSFEDEESDEQTKTARAVFECSKWRGTDITGEGDGRLERFDWNDKWLPYLEKHLGEDDNRMALELTKEAAELGRASFEVDWDMGLDADLRHLGNVRALARLLSLEACVLSKTKKVEPAMENVRLIFRLRSLVDEEPCLISKLVCIATDAIACDTLKGILLDNSPGRRDVERIMKELDGREDLNRLTHVLLGETIANLKVIEKFGNNPIDRYYYLKTMRSLRDISRDKVPDALNAPLLSRLDEKPKGISIYFTIGTRIVTPGYSGAFGAEARGDAVIRMARTALALSLYRAENGSYPDYLDVLVPEYLPEIQIDPFDGKPLRYRLEGNGYILYSVDQNRIDDGGVWAKDGKTGDWPWVMEK